MNKIIFGNIRSTYYINIIKIFYIWGDFMSIFNQGWLGLKKSMPQDPTDFIAVAQLDTIWAIAINSNSYSIPTSGSWTTPSVLLADPVSISYTNPVSRADLQYIATSIGIQSQLSNISGAPLPIQDIIFCFGNNKGRTDWQMNIPINFGAVNYNKFELSILENLATRGDEQGTIPVLDFGSGPFTGNKTLKLLFAEYFGLLNLGIHIEKSDGSKSSILILRCIVQPVNTGYNCCNPNQQSV